jgi:transcriptional regulator with XRE-family HTH domain
MRRKYPSPVEENTIGRRRSEIRKRRGMTQVQLAEKLGMSQPILYRYERGDLRLHGALIASFAKALRTKPEKILGLEDLQETGYTTDRRFASRLQKIGKLSKRDKELLLGTIDPFLSKVS